MHPLDRLPLLFFALLLIEGAARAGEFQSIDINKGNQKQRSKDYFAVEVAKGEHDCISFTVHVQANPEDKQVRSGLARLEIFEGDRRTAWIPLERQNKTDGSGHDITFEMSREMTARSILVLVHLTMEAGGNVYRVSLDSYTTDARTHQGVWKPIAAVLGGVRLPDDAVKAITLKITDVNYEVTVAGEEPDKGTCALDTSTVPHRMTITSTAGPNRGKTFLAIYEMKDDNSMRVCYDLSGKEFPKEFTAPKGTKLYLVGYRRQKEQPAENTPPQ